MYHPTEQEAAGLDLTDKGQNGEAVKKGFTLIELLIVVAIIGILAAIAVPNFLNAMTKAKISRVYADMKSIETAIETYNLDNAVYPHYIVNAGTKGPNGQPVSVSLIFQYMFTTPVAYLSTLSLMNPFEDVKKFRCPPTGPAGEATFSYGGSYSYWNRRQHSGIATDKNQWLLVTHGPTSTVICQGFPESSTQNQATYDFNDFRSRVYNISNGIISEGNVVRLGGELAGFETIVQ